MDKTDELYFIGIYQRILHKWGEISYSNILDAGLHRNIYKIWCDIMPREERLCIAKIAFQIVNQVYLIKTNTKILLQQKDPFDNAQELINLDCDPTYQKSYLTALQLICNSIIQFAEKGYTVFAIDPTEDKRENESPHLNILLDEQNRFIQFQAINMDKLEQTKAMLQITKMNLNKIQGPYQNATCIVRKKVQN